MIPEATETGDHEYECDRSGFTPALLPAKCAGGGGQGRPVPHRGVSVRAGIRGPGSDGGCLLPK